MIHTHTHTHTHTNTTHTHSHRAIMTDVVKDSRVLSLVNRPGLRQTLNTLLDQLGRCQKALNEFLEVSRVPRHSLQYLVLCSKVLRGV